MVFRKLVPFIYLSVYSILFFFFSLVSYWCYKKWWVIVDTGSLFADTYVHVIRIRGCGYTLCLWGISYGASSVLWYWLVCLYAFVEGWMSIPDSMLASFPKANTMLLLVAQLHPNECRLSKMCAILDCNLQKRLLRIYCSFWFSGV